MIIFNLDGTLADCEHRRHFVDKSYITYGIECTSKQRCLSCLRKLEKDQPNWKIFYESCEEDQIIVPVWEILITLLYTGLQKKIQIWSGRCESVRDKTERWLTKITSLGGKYDLPVIKMRPIGDNIPDDQLKELWLDEALAKGKKIEFVFDSDPDSIAIWRRRGIFVFDCNQSGREF